MPNEDFPLRVDGVTAGWAAERRPEDVIPAARTDAWQLVYVRSGTIEERCDDRRVLLRAGGLLFHQPAETFGMRPVGEVPPDVLRLDFLCTQAGMDRFRGAVFHAEPQEQHDLNWLMDAVTEYFEPPDTLSQATVPKEEQPYGAQQQLAIHLENLLILLARRYKRARKPGVRLRRERRQTALVDAAELRAIVEKVAATTPYREETSPNEAQSPPNPLKRISGKQRKATLEEYQQTFLQVPRIDDRKPVFVSSDVRDRLDRVVRILGGRRMSVSGIIENIVRHHLSLYEEDFEAWRKL